MKFYMCFLLLGLVSASPLSEELSVPLEAEELHQLETIRDSLEGNNDILTATVNAYTDKVLVNIDKLLKKDYDPTDIPDISKKIKHLFFSGEFTLSYGTLSDISTLHRDGETKVSYNKNTHKMDITIPLAFDNMKIQYDYKIKIMRIGPAGKVIGDISNVKMTINLAIDFDQLQMVFEEYQIRNSGHIALTFQGNLIYDWLVDIVSNSATVVLKPIILEVIERIVAGSLKSVIENVNGLINSFLGPTDQIYGFAPF